jgi:nucleotide-binding universal stress UspA family protein
MILPFRSILHPTDFSTLSTAAFVHALRIALASRCKLYLLHVTQDGSYEAAFPQVQRLLVQWGLLEEDDPPAAVSAKLGLDIENVTLDRQEPVEGILHFLSQHVCELVVLATHGRDGLDHWLKGSVAETVFSRSDISTLFVPRGTRGFVDQVSGDLRLRHALVPVDHSPVPYRAIKAARNLSALLAGADAKVDLLHVGRNMPSFRGSADPITLRYGNVVQTILDAAIEYDSDFICMATAGHHGMLDALRGSTTERVLRHAPCPVLAIPVA